MKAWFTLASLLAVTGCASTSTSLVELPRPNSGTYTFAEAEARKSEIRFLVLSPPDARWRSDTFVGFAVHIDRSDSIFVYSPSLPPQLVAFPSDRPITFVELQSLLDQYQSFLNGRPASVLITSELDPDRSASFAKVVDLVFQPSIQVFYKRGANQTPDRTRLDAAGDLGSPPQA